MKTAIITGPFTTVTNKGKYGFELYNERKVKIAVHYTVNSSRALATQEIEASFPDFFVINKFDKESVPAFIQRVAMFGGTSGDDADMKSAITSIGALSQYTKFNIV